MLPIKIIEEIAKPVTLALRLFGNVSAGTVMVLLILELIPPAIAPLPLIVWKLFSMVVAVLQGFLFSLLTILYFQSALADDEPLAAPPDATSHSTASAETGPAAPKGELDHVRR